MSFLERYLLGRLALPALLSLLLLCGVLFALQAMRIGHHLMGQGMDAGSLLMLVALSLPTLVVFAAPFALFAALLFTMGKLEETGELGAMRLAGASGGRIAGPGLLLSLAAAGLVLLAAGWLEPAALDRLRGVVVRDAVRVLLLEAQAGQFRELFPGTTLLVDRRGEATAGRARFEGFFLARGGDKEILIARGAEAWISGRGRVALELSQGEIQQRIAGARGQKGSLRRIRFATLSTSLDLGAALERHLGFLARIAEDPARPLGAAAGCLGLGALALLLALGPGARLRKALYGLLAVVGYQALLWTLVLLWPGVLAQLLLAGVVGGGAAVRIRRF